MSQEDFYSEILCMRIYFLIAGLPAKCPACFRLTRAGELPSKVSVKQPKIRIQLPFPEHLLCVKPATRFYLPHRTFVTAFCVWDSCSHSTDGEGDFFKSPLLVIALAADIYFLCRLALCRLYSTNATALTHCIPTTLGSRYCSYPHFADEETKAP